MSPARVAPSPVVLTHYGPLPAEPRPAHPVRPLPQQVGNRTRATATARTGIDALALQCHALARALAPHSPAFASALERMPAGWQHDLDLGATVQLLRALTHLPRSATRDGRVGMLRDALFDLLRAARAEQLLHACIAVHAERESVNNMPGALKETGGGGGLGAGVGLPLAAEAGAVVGAARTVNTATFDDLAVARFDTVTLNLLASAEAGLPAAVGAQAGLEPQVSWGQGRIDDKMPDHVLALARASVARRLGGSRVVRTLKGVFNPGRDRYAERISRALAWQSRLPLLLGARSGAPVPTFHAAPPVPIEATLKTRVTPVGAGAAWGPAGVNVRASREKTKVHIDLPLRLTDRDADAMRARTSPQVKQELDARLQAVLTHRDDPHSPALKKVHALWTNAGSAYALDARREAVTLLAREFDHLEALVRLRMDSPGLAKLPLASLLDDWCDTPSTREAAMIRMLDTLAWLQATPVPPNAPCTPSHRDTWNALQADVEALANRIHDSAFPHDRRDVHRGTHAFADMQQRIQTWRATLEASAQWTVLSAGARASVARQQRADSDPLRDGTYVDVTLAGDFTPSVATLLGEAQGALGESVGTLPVAQINQALTALEPSFGSTGHAHCVLRFFRPSFQDDPQFPAGARGMHLQAIRLAAGSTLRMDLKPSVPVLPAVLLKLRLHAHRTELVPQHEHFCDGTLTGALLRYKSLRTRDTDALATWNEMVTLHGADLDRLARALARPESVPANEARYWLQRHSDAINTPGKRGRVELLQAVARPAADTQQRRDALHALFMALTEATQEAKRASPLIGPAMLPPSPLT